MLFSAPLIWFFAGLAFLVLELILPGFIVIFFAFGCFIASISTWILGINVTVQTWVFIVSSLLLLVTLRKYSLRFFKGDVQNEMDDDYVDSKVGKHAVVTKKITPALPGEIKFMGSFWRAAADSTVEEGVTVVIDKKASENGLTFLVKPLEK